MGWLAKATLFIVGLTTGILAVDWDVETALDQYVHSDDGYFSWQEIASYNYEGVTLYILNMTSQMYQTEEFSTRPIWWHFMGVAIPDTISDLETAILMIEGGDNDEYETPPRQDARGLACVGFANDTGLISAYIHGVPNQPVYFHNDPTFRKRSEDNIIAWTWRTFVDSEEPSDPTVIERMPMTKAAKRGLDTVTEVATLRRPETNIQKFVATGASKRGWTTWSLAATDQRVIAMIPLVFSMINMEGGTILQHNQDMDGGWSFAFNPYWRENLTQEFHNPKFSRVWEVEDMWYYRERLTLPILEMVSSGDEFFLPDDNHFWWDDIPEPKWLMMLPNAEHVMAPHYRQIYGTMVSFIVNLIEENQFPTVSWEMGNTDTGGFIHFVADPAPATINAYVAVTLANDTRRDFRLAALDEEGDTVFHPVFWRQNLTIVDMGNGEYHVEAEEVEGEWVGFFVEGVWEGQMGHDMVFTSQVNIIPNTYPRAACTDADSCYGKLV